MDERLVDYLLRTAAAVLTVAGIVGILVGYLGLRNEANVELQVPYLMSGGLGGLALVGLGALALIQVQMRVQARRFSELTDQLDEWKEQALNEVRRFLEDAEIEVVVDQPVGASARRTTRSATPADGRRTS